MGARGGGRGPPQQGPHVVCNTHSAAWRASGTMQCWNSDGFSGTVCGIVPMCYTTGAPPFPHDLSDTGNPPNHHLWPSSHLKEYIYSVAGSEVGAAGPEKSYAATRDCINNSHKFYFPLGILNTYNTPAPPPKYQQGAISCVSLLPANSLLHSKRSKSANINFYCWCYRFISFPVKCCIARGIVKCDHSPSWTDGGFKIRNNCIYQ